MENLRMTLVQTDLHWENPGANLAMLEEKIRAIAAPTDLVVLPEMFTTGFTMNAAAVAEPMNLTTFKWLRMMASHTGAVVAGSYVVRENGRFSTAWSGCGPMAATKPTTNATCSAWRTNTKPTRRVKIVSFPASKPGVSCP